MEKIAKLFDWMGRDGMMHVIVSAALTALLALVLHPLWAGLAVLGIGVFKEAAWDYGLRRGTAEWKDMACDLLGVVIGML